MVTLNKLYMNFPVGYRNWTPFMQSIRKAKMQDISLLDVYSMDSLRSDKKGIMQDIVWIPQSILASLDRKVIMQDIYCCLLNGLSSEWQQSNHVRNFLLNGIPLEWQEINHVGYFLLIAQLILSGETLKQSCKRSPDYYSNYTHKTKGAFGGARGAIPLVLCVAAIMAPPVWLI